VTHAVPVDVSRPGTVTRPLRSGTEWRRVGSLIGASTRPTTQAFAAASFLAGLLANLALALSARQFPLEDATNNLTRYVMLDRAWFGGSGVLAPYVHTHFVVGPYLGLDVIGALLVHVAGARNALYALAALAVCALPVGCWLLFRATGRANAAWSLAGVLIGMGFFTVVGFVNYVIGLGAALVWLAAWWPTRAAPSSARMVALGFGLAGLYLLHLSAPLIVMAVVGLDLALYLFSSDGSPSDTLWHRTIDRLQPRRTIGDRRLLFAVEAVLVVVAMCLLGGIGAAPPAPRGVVDYPALAHKLINLASPFYVFSFRQTLMTVVTYCFMALAFFWINRHTVLRGGRVSPFLLASGVCVALFFVFPAGTPGTGYLDMRWLTPAFLWPFCAAESEGRSPPRAITALMLAGCLLHTALLGHTLRSIDRDLANYSAVLGEIPPGKAVLPLIADGDRYGFRVFPYRHYAFWYVIERRGRVPGLFNGDGEGGGRPRHGFLAHFVEQGHLYEPGERWGTREFTPLDWSQIERDYSYIIEAGADPRATRLIKDHAREVARAGDVTLFEVEGATP
jgi:hypothetical protein